jgi:hypothetical protein
MTVLCWLTPGWKMVKEFVPIRRIDLATGDAHAANFRSKCAGTDYWPYYATSKKESRRIDQLTSAVFGCLDTQSL